MILSIIPILAVFLAGFGMAIFLSGRAKNLARILIILALAVILVPATFIGIVIVAFSTPNAEFYSAAIAIFALLAFILVCLGVCGAFKKKNVVPIITLMAVCAVSAVGYFSYNRYIASIPTVGEMEEHELRSYYPYAENTKVVIADSTLKLSEDLPKLDGATALFPIYSAFARAVYPKELIEDLGESASRYNHPYLKCTKTSEAYSSIVTGDADIIFAAEPSEEQKQFAKENGVELVYTPIGKEAFVFFVNSKNPIDNISVEDVRGIYSGRITSWEELGIKKLGSIKAFQRPEGSGSQSAIVRMMNGETLAEPPKTNIIDTMSGIITKTADYKNFKNAIGYSFRFYSTEMAANKQIKLLSLGGAAPTKENIENGTYPVASYFYAVTRSDASDNTKRLLDWITSKEGQEIIEKTGYTPLN